jgi:hypothetical protein
MSWTDWVLQAVYVGGLLTLIGLSLIALFKRDVWINALESVLLLCVCVSAIALFEAPPRPPVIGLVLSASLLCISVYRRWRGLDSDRKRAAIAAMQSAAAATVAAHAATQAADAATRTAAVTDSDSAREVAYSATAAAADAVQGAAEATQAAAAVAAKGG